MMDYCVISFETIRINQVFKVTTYDEVKSMIIASKFDKIMKKL